MIFKAFLMSLIKLLEGTEQRMDPMILAQGFLLRFILVH